MADFQQILLRLQGNLNILEERQAKYGDQVSLELLNQIEDHEQAIVLTEQAIAGELTEAEWQEATQPLLLALESGQVIKIEAETYVAGDQNIYQTLKETPLWQWLSRFSLILGIIIGILGLIGTFLAVPQVNRFFFSAQTPTPTHLWHTSITPLPFNPAKTLEEDALILIATFHVSNNLADTETHRQIRRSLNQLITELELTSVNIKIDPTVLNADARAEAEALGEKHNANIVIWGEDTGVKIIVNFLNLREPKFGAADITIEETDRTQLSTSSGRESYNHFITEDLPGQLTFLSLLAIGHLYSNQSMYDNAISLIEHGIISLVPGTDPPEGLALAFYGLGWLYQKRQPPDNKASLNYYTLAIEFNPEYTSAYNNRGNIYREKGEFDDAISDFERAIDLNPNYAIVYNNRGLVFKQKGEIDAAIADYDRAIELDPKYISAYGNRGIAYKAQGDLEQAVAEFSQIIKLDPTIARAYYDRGHTYKLLGKSDDAISDYTQAIELDSQYLKVYFDRGNLFVELGDFEKAIADFTQAITLDSTFAAAYSRRGNAYWEQGELAAALSDANRAISLDPEHASAYNGLGLVHQAQGDLESALADYEKAIELDPEMAAAYNNRGNVHREFGNLITAFNDYSRAIEIDPNYSLAYVNRGVYYHGQNRMAEALADLNQAVDLDPTYPIAYKQRGDVYRELGDLDKAITDYSRAIDLDQNYASAYASRGETYRDRRDLYAAIDDFSQAIELEDNNPYFYHVRGILYGNLGDFTAAIADYDQAINLNPENASIYFNRGFAYKSLGDLEQAIADFENGLTRESDPEIRERATEDLRQLRAQLEAQQSQQSEANE